MQTLSFSPFFLPFSLLLFSLLTLPSLFHLQKPTTFFNYVVQYVCPSPGLRNPHWMDLLYSTRFLGSHFPVLWICFQ